MPPTQQRDRKAPQTKAHLQFVFTWSVKDIARFGTYAPGDSLNSPKFQTQINGQQYTWQIELYPNGYNEEHQGWLSMFLVLQGGSRETLRGSYIVAVIGESYEELNPEESEIVEFNVDDGVGHDRYLQMNLRQLKTQRFLQNSNTLVLQYRLNLDTSAFQGGAGYSDNMINRRGSVKGKHMEEMFSVIETPKKAEYNLVVTAGDGGKFYCKREVLSEASEALEQLCQPDAIEDEGDVQELNIENAPTATVREVLRYIYCGQAAIGKENVDKHEFLQVAADWELTALLAECERAMMTDLKPENAIRYYLDGHQHGMPLLKAKALSEILSNMSAAARAKDWSKLMAKPKLVKELFYSGPILTASFVGINSRPASSRPKTTVSTHNRQRYQQRKP